MEKILKIANGYDVLTIQMGQSHVPYLFAVKDTPYKSIYGRGKVVKKQLDFNDGTVGDICIPRVPSVENFGVVRSNSDSKEVISYQEFHIDITKAAIFDEYALRVYRLISEMDFTEE